MFKSVTIKALGAATIALLLVLAVSSIIYERRLDNRDKAIAAHEQTIESLTGNLAIARSNTALVESALNQCNDNADSVARTAAAVAKAGTDAVEAVQKAGAASTAKAVRALSAMPTDGPTAAEQCAQADAILLQGAQ